MSKTYKDKHKHSIAWDKATHRGLYQSRKSDSEKPTPMRVRKYKRDLHENA